MNLLIPLGLLGLLSVIALILIYIIKPNYQQKRISSTYVWKLSLKYRKKTVPISRLSQILIFICQLLVLTLCAIMLAKPAVLEERVDYKAESVIIIDASASMMMTENGISRFEKAVAEAKSFADDVMLADGVLSVIVADSQAHFLAQRSNRSDEAYISDGFASLQEKGVGSCTFGSADIEGAVALAEQVLDVNSNTKVYLYTDTAYINTNGIEVVSFAEEDEWNAAVLDCVATVEDDNYYSISVDVGCYGKTEQLEVNCDIYGVNDIKNKEVHVSKPVFLHSLEEEATVKFTSDDFDGDGIYSFERVAVHIDVNDGFEYDNFFDYYGGSRPKIRIQYASSNANPFFETICRRLRTNMKSKWDIEYKILRDGESPENAGFDLYIFEHKMPNEIPTDGVVLLFDPDKAPTNAGFRLGDYTRVNENSTLGLGREHYITQYVNPDNITISNYKKVISADGFDEVLYYAQDPVMFVKNQNRAKIVLCTFDVHYSNEGIRKEFPILMYNIFNYFIPSTLEGYLFDVGESVKINARGEDLTVYAPIAGAEGESFYDLPTEYAVNSPGTYTLTQKAMNGSSIIEKFYVKVPSFESNTTQTLDSLPLLHVKTKHEYADRDLLMYFAAAMFVIIFIEWLLQAREYFR